MRGELSHGHVHLLHTSARVMLILGLALMAMALLPATGGAKPPPPPAPQLDTATATGSILASGITEVLLDVHSGPSGENPGGTAGIGGYTEIKGQPIPVAIGGTPTCVNVTGNTAVIGIENATAVINGSFFISYGPVKFTAQDNGGSGLDRFGFSPGSSECSTPGGTEPLNGRAVVFDAQPPPTSRPNA